MPRSLSVALFVLLLGVGAVAAVGIRVRNGDDLPYTTVDYKTHDAKAAFAAQGIRLTSRSHAPGIADFANAHDVVEVTVFGQPSVVRRTGFRDLDHGRDCTVAGHLALHWRGNVRAIVNCDLVGNDRRWIARVDRALAALP